MRVRFLRVLKRIQDTCWPFGRGVPILGILKFDKDYYLSSNPDVRSSGAVPLWHYIRYGRQEGRAPNGLDGGSPGFVTAERSVRAASPSDIDNAMMRIRDIAPEFDVEFYLARYPDVKDSGMNPVAHFELYGWRECRSPTNWFSTTSYLKAHSDVLAADINPFWHYVVAGRGEGRLLQDGGSVDDVELLRGEFDEKFYFLTNPDLPTDIDTLGHFMMHGWHEGRDPTLWFSVDQYLEEYQDVKRAGINPFLHYIRTGRHEGRDLKLPLSFQVEHVLSLRSRQNANQASPSLENLAPLNQDFEATIRDAQFIHLTISHDDYTKSVGGVQICIERERRAIMGRGATHVHLFPAIVNSRVAAINSQLLGVIVDGKPMGYSTPEALGEIFVSVGSISNRRAAVIHSLIGHHADDLCSLLERFNPHVSLYWIHDYSSICSGYNLLRNNVEFCGGPPRLSNACMICQHGVFRDAQIEAHAKVFARLSPKVIAPSRYALDLWESVKPAVYPSLSTEIVQHCDVTIPSGKVRRQRKDEKIRVAFLGHPSAHKGWHVFRQLVKQHIGSSYLEFVHIGSAPSGDLRVEFVKASVSPENPEAMVKSIEACRVDIAIVWPSWPETFCITAYEAIAAGAIVVTNNGSGNVADFVRETEAGIVLATEDELSSFFTNKVKLHKMRSRPRYRRRFIFSNVSADIVASELEL